MKISTVADDKGLRKKGRFVRLKGRELRALPMELPGWRVVKHHHLAKSFSFPDFKKALSFVNKIGRISESLEHHPDIFLGYGKVEIKTFDHKTNGLVGLDCVLANRIDKAFNN